jgi:hypothetical protein
LCITKQYLLQRKTNTTNTQNNNSKQHQTTKTPKKTEIPSHSQNNLPTTKNNRFQEPIKPFENPFPQAKQSVSFSRKNFAIFKLKTVPPVHGKVSRTTTRFFRVLLF